jgi:phosphoribosylanthranilate isomerase
MTRVKICGINSADAIDAAVEGGADWIGFVFFPPSPRFITPSRARALSARHPSVSEGGPPRVGLFVNPTEAMIAEALADVALDILQLYAAPGVARELGRRFDRPVWRAAGVASMADLPVAMDGADALLIEAKPPAGATRPGGNAVRFDWTLMRGWRAPGAWVLAGGLDPDDVGEAIRLSGATAVDVSSGVEREKGVKDPALIRAFIQAARGGRRRLSE